MLPFGSSTVALVRTLRTSSSVRPIEASSRGIDLHADRGRLLTADQHLADARKLRDLLLDEVLGVVVDLGDRRLIRLHRQDQDRASDGLISRKVGGLGMSFGNEPCAALIASSTSVSALHDRCRDRTAA